MPIRRLNFTNRQRVSRDHIEISLRSRGSKMEFDARFDLGAYKFPPDARVFLEAYRQTTLARFDFGTVSVPLPPLDRTLDEFDSPVEVLFRLRVTAISALKGMLLGEADGIRAQQPEEKPNNRVPLLPVIPDDLGEEIWRIEFSSSATYLAINNQLPDWKETARNPVFRALVYPAAMRQILDRILRLENVTTVEDARDWRSLWLRFATLLPGSSAVPTKPEDYEDWIDESVAALARQCRFRTTYQTAEQG
jgi:hypothetical protein